MIYVIYNKETGKISQTVTGIFDPRYLPSQDSYIEITQDNEQPSINSAEYYVENGELKKAEGRPSMQHIYDTVTHEWVRIGPEPDMSTEVISRRNTLLAESDWVVTKAVEAGQPVPQNWQDYRQALRDITAQPGFPNEVTWPEKPV